MRAKSPCVNVGRVLQTKWYCEVYPPPNGWVPYDDYNQQIIEKAFNAHKSNTGSSLLPIQVGTFNYTINFATMQQIGQVGNSQRKILRTDPGSIERLQAEQKKKEQLSRMLPPSYKSSMYSSPHEGDVVPLNPYNKKPVPNYPKKTKKAEQQLSAAGWLIQYRVYLLFILLIFALYIILKLISKVEALAEAHRKFEEDHALLQNEIRQKEDQSSGTSYSSAGNWLTLAFKVLDYGIRLQNMF